MSELPEGLITVPVRITHGERRIKAGLKCTLVNEQGEIMRDDVVLMPGTDCIIDVPDRYSIYFEHVEYPKENEFE